MKFQKRLALLLVFACLIAAAGCGPTPSPAPTPTPTINPKTVLYYNTDGGSYYHADKNCPRVSDKFLPLKGSFKYSELNDTKYKKLEPCDRCGAPARP